MAFVQNGHKVLWQVVTDDTVLPVLMAAEGEMMDELLLHFSMLFTEPSGLPPQRACHHQIRLLLGTTPVAVWPYRYSHTQKLELERQ
jgi:hypothetical protein